MATFGAPRSNCKRLSCVGRADAAVRQVHGVAVAAALGVACQAAPGRGCCQQWMHNCPDCVASPDCLARSAADCRLPLSHRYEENVDLDSTEVGRGSSQQARLPAHS